MDEERHSDTSETFGSQDPPGDHSNQNAEEQPGGGDAGASKGSRKKDDGANPGGAGEDSQATGHPGNAG